MVSTVTLMAMVAVSVSTQAAPAATLSPIQIKSPPSTTLLAGQTLQLAATGTYSDGTVVNIRSQVAWSISDNKAAKISPPDWSGLSNLLADPVWDLDRLDLAWALVDQRGLVLLLDRAGPV